MANRGVTTAARRSTGASDTCSWTRKAWFSEKVHSAKVPDQDGIKLLLKGACERLPRLSHLWVDAGYRGRGKEWAERALGLSVEVVHRTPKPTPEKVLFAWAREWHKEGRSVDLDRLLPLRGFEALPRRWVVERTFFAPTATTGG